MKNFVMDNTSKNYEQNWKEIINAWAGVEQEENDDSFFCSELVAACWKDAGILGPDSKAANSTITEHPLAIPKYIHTHTHTCAVAHHCIPPAKLSPRAPPIVVPSLAFTHTHTKPRPLTSPQRSPFSRLSPSRH